MVTSASTLPADSLPDGAAPQSEFSSTLRIIATAILSFACYITIGMQLAVVPSFVHLTLHFSAVIAGLAVSVQYVATLASRPFAGHTSDTKGAKRATASGLCSIIASGALFTIAAFLRHDALASLLALCLSRLGLGCGAVRAGGGGGGKTLRPGYGRHGQHRDQRRGRGVGRNDSARGDISQAAAGVRQSFEKSHRRRNWAGPGRNWVRNDRGVHYFVLRQPQLAGSEFIADALRRGICRGAFGIRLDRHQMGWVSGGDGFAGGGMRGAAGAVAGTRAAGRANRRHHRRFRIFAGLSGAGRRGGPKSSGGKPRVGAGDLHGVHRFIHGRRRAPGRSDRQRGGLPADFPICRSGRSAGHCAAAEDPATLRNAADLRLKRIPPLILSQPDYFLENIYDVSSITHP